VKNITTNQEKGVGVERIKSRILKVLNGLAHANKETINVCRDFCRVVGAKQISFPRSYTIDAKLSVVAVFSVVAYNACIRKKIRKKMREKRRYG
jgi:hypothetical protein